VVRLDEMILAPAGAAKNIKNVAVLRLLKIGVEASCKKK
jgi:hypothetical protein